MKIFVYVDGPDLLEDPAPVSAAISDWVQSCDCMASLVDETDEASGDQLLGLRLDTGKKAMLKKALDHLYGLARTHDVDFAVGYIDEAGRAHKVCFFGSEEGRPDISEIGSYLGLKR